MFAIIYQLSQHIKLSIGSKVYIIMIIKLYNHYWIVPKVDVEQMNKETSKTKLQVSGTGKPAKGHGYSIECSFEDLLATIPSKYY